MFRVTLRSMIHRLPESRSMIQINDKIVLVDLIIDLIVDLQDLNRFSLTLKSFYIDLVVDLIVYLIIELDH